MNNACMAITVPYLAEASDWVDGLGSTDRPRFIRDLFGNGSPATHYPDSLILVNSFAGQSIANIRQLGLSTSGGPIFAFPQELEEPAPIVGTATGEVVFVETSGLWDQQVRSFGMHFYHPMATTKTPLVVQSVNTTAPSRNQDAEKRFRTAFQRGREERFEDGMESDFSNELESLVRTYGPNSKQILARLLEDKSISGRVWGEAMRCLGRLDDSGSYGARLWVLEKGLSSDSELIRDGAALGLASMDDLNAIPYLERAVRSETFGSLRSDMQDVLSQLTRR